MIQDLFDNSFENLLRKTKISKLALAVSGGVDSISLLVLILSWSKKHNTKVWVLNVDHNIRAESKYEAEYVKKIAEDLGYKFISLSWDHEDNKSAVQERARVGRYELMTKKCKELGIDTLLTAHHLDDILETYIMRKRKQSGILGLSSSKSFFYNNIRIFFSKLY